MSDFILETKKGWEYYHLPTLTAVGIVHGFFTRRSPNMVFFADEKEAFLGAFSLNEAVIMDQVHGHDIHVVGGGDSPRSGDGFLVKAPGIAGIIKTADCLCVILVDPAVPMFAIVHAGWRGTLEKITSKALRMMIQLGASRQRIEALFGPSIRGCCYEVGRELFDAFRSEGFSGNIFARRGESFFLDLYKANRELVANEGVGGIHDTGLCTCCGGNTFASYRRGDREARQANFAAIRKRESKIQRV